MAETMQDIVVQEWIEEHYNRKHIDVKIRGAIELNPVMDAKLKEGIKLVNEYLKGTYYESKMKRIAQLKNMDVEELVLDMFVGVAYFQLPELFTSASSQMAARLKLSNKTEAITTVAELLAVLCQTDAFDITKASKMASLMLVSKIPLGDDLIGFIEGSQFLPPMICEPMELTHNYSSGYLTHNDSLLLGSENHHDGDLCLDVLNIMNKVALQLDTKFLSIVEEESNHILDTLEKEEQWRRFKKQSYTFYELITKNGNCLYFHHKVDKRGRIYSHGYHIHSQGTSFKKAILEFANEELIEGMP